MGQGLCQQDSVQVVNEQRALGSGVVSRSDASIRFNILYMYTRFEQLVLVYCVLNYYVKLFSGITCEVQSL